MGSRVQVGICSLETVCSHVEVISSLWVVLLHFQSLIGHLEMLSDLLPTVLASGSVAFLLKMLVALEAAFVVESLAWLLMYSYFLNFIYLLLLSYSVLAMLFFLTFLLRKMVVDLYGFHHARFAGCLCFPLLWSSLYRQLPHTEL